MQLAVLFTSMGYAVDTDNLEEMRTGFKKAHRTTAVHYLKATLDREAVAAITGGTAPVAIVADHPRLTARAELGRAALARLAEDLKSS